MRERTFESAAEAVAWALRFEAGIGLVAIVLGMLLGYSAVDSLQAATRTETATDIFWGVVATLPLIAILIVSDYWPVGPLRSLQKTMDEKVLQLFRDASWDQLALVALAAGLGEEMLFRGVLQVALTDWSGPWWAVSVTAIIFGLCHYISHVYFIFAALIGLYLGLLFIATGNLLTPITTHALYDFLALIYLLKWRHSTTLDVSA